MDVKNGKLHEVSFAQIRNGHLTATVDAAGQEHEPHLTELVASPSLTQRSPGHVLVPARQVSEKDLNIVSGLVADTHNASLAFQKCMSSRGSSHIAYLSLVMISQRSQMQNAK